jgi:hypothetical protein
VARAGLPEVTAWSIAEVSKTLGELDHRQEERSKAERRSATSIGCGGTAHDVMDPNQPLITLDIEEDPIVPDPLAELGGMVSQWQDVSLRRIEGKLIQRPLDAMAITQRKLSQISPCAVREDQLPGHA